MSPSTMWKCNIDHGDAFCVNIGTNTSSCMAYNEVCVIADRNNQCDNMILISISILWETLNTSLKLIKLVIWMDHLISYVHRFRHESRVITFPIQNKIQSCELRSPFQRGDNDGHTLPVWDELCLQQSRILSGHLYDTSNSGYCNHFV